MSRWSETTQAHVRSVLEMLGPTAYVFLRRAGTLLGDAVSAAKVTIIVRSVVVGAANIASNILHLSLAGVPIADIARGSQAKFAEITAYVRNREEIQKLQVQAGALALDPAKLARVSARIRALEEANARMSIAPLIEAGEFSTISENLTEADVAIREGRWADHLEKVVDKLPEGGSSLFQLLLQTCTVALCTTPRMLCPLRAVSIVR